MKPVLLKLFSIPVVLAVLLSNTQLPAVRAQERDGLSRQVNTESGRVSFISPAGGRSLSSALALGQSIRPQDPAMALAVWYAPEFGLQDAERNLTRMESKRSDVGQVSVRFQQNHDGIPVMGGELIVNTNAGGDLYSISGEVSPDISTSTRPAIDAEQARQAALGAMAKWYGKTAQDFVATEPELWFFDESLLQRSTRPVELTWRMEVTARHDDMPVRELVLVNAQHGGISLHFNQVDTAWTHDLIYEESGALAGSTTNTFTGLTGLANGNLQSIKTYTAGNGTTLPGTLLCDEGAPGCTDGSDLQADKAHLYAIGTYELYLARHDRNSIDGSSLPILSTVHFNSGYANAFWDGEQMVYGDAYGFSLADDVVAHELTHGVTQYEANLFYYYQSGAINESFSDLWGEYFDQTNGQGDDSAGMKWLMGEDILGMGAIRSMSNPPDFGDPDRMTSPNYQMRPYYDYYWDNGGVHTNSGVNNKAVYLMVDGGSFNNKTVNGLGWDKVGAIYYEVNSKLLTSGADYSDLYYALQKACKNLTGQKGITEGDCAEVKNAADAVEMNAQPAANYNPDAPLCTVPGTLPNIYFADDLENDLSRWTFSNEQHIRWQLNTPIGPYAQSGNHSLFANDYPAEVTDAKAGLSSFVVPANAYLWFAQAYEFEFYSQNYDGGVLEYSTDGGSTWKDAQPFMDYNGYNGIISNTSSNPLKGRSAFVGSSHGYTSTRLDLSSLAGQAVRFRWRMGLDEIGYATGWAVDNIKVYTCGTTFADVPVTHPYSADIELLYANGLTGGCGTSPLRYCPDQIMDRAQAAVFMVRGAFGGGYVPNPASYLFKDDWSKVLYARPWAEAMRESNLTTGCKTSPLLYCPLTKLNREQAVIFGLKMKYGTYYQPPPATGMVFADMTNPNYWAAPWVEKAYADGLITDCGTASNGKPKFCPGALVTRGLGAYIIVRAKNLSTP